MVRRCADAPLYQTAAEKRLSERGGANTVGLSGLNLRVLAGAPCARWRSARYGIGPVVVGILAVSVYRLGKAAIKEHSLIAIGVAAAGVMFSTSVDLIVTLLDITSFSLIQNASDTRNGEALVIFQFDLLHVDGEDPSALPLVERKAS
jgi:hypothetical protein